MAAREWEIVTVLSNCVRVMSVGQISRTWWSDTRWGKSRSRKILREMADGGWLQVRPVLSRPIQMLEKPLLVWEPGKQIPDFFCLSQRLHQRAGHAAESVEVVLATRKANSLMGKRRLSTVKLTQMTHDLHVTEVFLKHRQCGMELKRWVSEDALPSEWPIQQRPDAVILDSQNNLSRAVEFGGDYTAERLAELHNGLSEVGLSYEIW